MTNNEEDFSNDDTETGKAKHGKELPASSKNESSKFSKVIQDKLIQDEAKTVKRARLVVFIALIISALSVSVAVFLSTQRSDTETFELKFEGYVNDVMTIVQWDIQYNFALMQQVSAATTVAARLTGEKFPYVTQPQFEIAGGYADGMGGIMAVAYAPRIVAEQKSDWEAYSVQHQEWLEESFRLKVAHPSHRDAMHGTFQDHEHDRRTLQQTKQEEAPPKIAEKIYKWENGVKIPETTEPGQVLYPIWQVSPPDYSPINNNLLSDERVMQLYNTMVATNQSVLSGHLPIEDMWDFMFDPHEKVQKPEPHAFIMEPVYGTFEEEKDPILEGILLGLTSWKNIFDRLLPEGANGIICVVKGRCASTFTFELNGQKSKFLGDGDLHDHNYDHLEHSIQLELYTKEAESLCVHHLYIYPSATFEEIFTTKKPIIYTSVVVVAFTITAILLFVYDYLVTHRQKKTTASAMRTDKLVASLFPANVRERLMHHNDMDMVNNARGGSGEIKSSQLFGNGENHDDMMTGTPIADFFPHTTVMFADIAGFTAWSSTREPFQVFKLLENIYGSLDKIVKRRGVFKVETIGDCYVAVAGMPEYREDHAIVMAEFARDCISTIKKVCRRLEVFLGPETADLTFRIGLHTGAVTGGVIRGENARFQLFGDTMNTASRIESTGAPGAVHVSKTTADLLIEAGKSDWLKARPDKVIAKGKGELDTYWLVLDTNGSNSSIVGTTMLDSTTSISSNDDSNGACDGEGQPGTSGITSSIDDAHISTKNARLIAWNSSVLRMRLKFVVAQREDCPTPQTLELGTAIKEQLDQYITGICHMYNSNKFHNFEHANHVTMSVTKLLSRVKNCEESDTNDASTSQEGFINDITSDPLAQFALCFSALIHDVDHTGVPNSQLIKEGAPIAARYNNQSVAEHNSMDLAWEFFLQPEFDDLRACLCPYQNDLDRFHELVINAVLATDIVDKKLKEDRNARWAKVFTEAPMDDTTDKSTTNHLRSRIVLEHLIQASDVAHTMQHWHIYRKWNERFFVECYTAYQEGRMEQNPTETWYKGEIGFFDFYIIPLAQKLHECGVFGVSSDEYLNYALQNRHEWELKGRDVVNEYVEKYC